jgi:hypothetical protein
MKIVTHTPTELIIRDNALGLRVFGGVLLILVAVVYGIGLAQDTDGNVSTLMTLLGAGFAAVGLSMLVLPWRKTFAFSKGERVFIMAKQRFGRVERDTIPLRDIADVSVEESTSSEGGTYRVTITLADQRRIPWTSYYSSGLAPKRAMVDVVRDFLQLDPNPRLGSGALTAKDEADIRKGRVGLYVMGAFCCLFLAIGGTLVAKEHRRLTTYEPVTATVLSARVQDHSDSDGTTYEPVIAYRYRVNGREYTASRVTPLKESRSGRWAHRVTARYEVGNNYTAYYDPANPGEAFLQRSRSIIPWAFLLIGLAGLMFVGIGIRGSYAETRMTRWPRRA